MSQFTFPAVGRRLLIGALLPLSGLAHAVGIQGEIRNLSVGQGERALVLLTNLAEGRIVGMGNLQGNFFSLSIPDGFRPPVRPAGLCPGVRSTPSEPRTYVAEQLMVFQPARNAVTLLAQADHPHDPTRRSQWMYSDRVATIRGRCTGLNTHYDLTLRAGWNAVMTVSESGRFLVRNATPGLPYWTASKSLTPARTLFPGIFDGN